MSNIRTFSIALALGIALVASGGDKANAVSCPGTAVTTDREFSVDTTPASSCHDSGLGNEIGLDVEGRLLIDKYEDTQVDGNQDGLDDNTEDGLMDGALTIVGTNTTSGTFAIVAPGFFDLLLVLKSGNGVLDPDWAAFLLGALTGDWSISGNQALSHASIYGRVFDNAVIPLPPAVILFGTALVGMTILGRRRRAKRSGQLAA